jgi:hypothetical protein
MASSPASSTSCRQRASGVEWGPASNPYQPQVHPPHQVLRPLAPARQLVGKAQGDQASAGVVVLAEESAEAALLGVGQRAAEGLGADDRGECEQGEEGEPEEGGKHAGAPWGAGENVAPPGVGEGRKTPREHPSGPGRRALDAPPAILDALRGLGPGEFLFLGASVLSRETAIRSFETTLGGLEIGLSGLGATLRRFGTAPGSLIPRVPWFVPPAPLFETPIRSIGTALGWLWIALGKLGTALR